MGSGKISWTPDNDAKLFVAVMEIHEFKIDYDGLSKRMQALTGVEVTVSSIKNRMQKIKTASKSDGSPPKLSPSKRTATAAGGTPTKANKRRSVAEGSTHKGRPRANTAATETTEASEAANATDEMDDSEELEVKDEDDGDDISVDGEVAYHPPKDEDAEAV